MQQQQIQTTETNEMDQLVIKLLDKKSIENPIFGDSSVNNQRTEHEQKINNTAKLLINRIKHLEQKLYSLSLEFNSAKEQLEIMLSSENNTEQVEIGRASCRERV